MRKILLATSLTCLLFSVRAQVLINLQLPPAGLQVKSQLWNLSLVNTTNAGFNVQLNMTLADLTTGQPILTGTTTVFNLPAGLKQIQLSDVVPIQYNVVNNSYNINNSSDGFLPIGTFLVCFDVLKINSETVDNIAGDCEAIQVEPASPPILQTPYDQEEIEEARPLFTWSPPAPLSLFNNLNYDLKLVEVGSNQSSGDAIQNNLPVYYQNFIGSASLQYPFSINELDTSVLYAWQVRAYSNGWAACNSEIFTFTLKNNQTTSAFPNKIYARLKGITETPLTITKSELLFEYINAYNNELIDLVLTDITNKTNVLISLHESIIQVHYGQNFIKVDLSQSNLINNHIYQLQILGLKGESQAIRFIYKAD